MHMQTKHAGLYWPMYHDPNLVNLKFPDGIFFCGRCSAPYRDADRCKQHLFEKRGSGVAQKRPDLSIIPIAEVYRCNVCGWRTDSVAMLADHIKDRHQSNVETENGDPSTEQMDLISLFTCSSHGDGSPDDPVGPGQSIISCRYRKLNCDRTDL
ncbi:hypothetical protein N7541_010712 [Penicillium brevicompactum]|uniref:C2H2-type domain-containing protein n=1 Tax=Penicillium brevicompactum TaxID=5074 RepID=A0A9W9UF48_PENBR|nr:hypothetical protein N7452_005476 [Penicillium brevicompactum]KAJ5341588.1 hypothetical protein N7541_010712 [Penicillium brevicompactum]